MHSYERILGIHPVSVHQHSRCTCLGGKYSVKIHFGVAPQDYRFHRFAMVILPGHALILRTYITARHFLGPIFFDILFSILANTAVITAASPAALAPIVPLFIRPSLPDSRTLSGLYRFLYVLHRYCHQIPVVFFCLFFLSFFFFFFFVMIICLILLYIVILLCLPPEQCCSMSLDMDHSKTPPERRLKTKGNLNLFTCNTYVHIYSSLYLYYVPIFV